MNPVDIRSVAITGLFVLAVFYTLHMGRAFFLPVTLAGLLSFLFSPLVRWLHRQHVPRWLGSALVLVALLSGIMCGVARLSGPAGEWLAKAPDTLRQFESRAQYLLPPTARLRQAAAQVQQMADGEPSQTPTVQVKQPGWRELALSWTTGLIGAAVVTLALLYLLLASGDAFIRKLAQLLRLEQKTHVVEIARETESTVSRYLFTVTVINACFGLAVGSALWLLGLSNPLLWGVTAGLLNFIPYFGPLTGCAVLALAAVMQFQTWGQVLLPSGVYLGLHAIESNLITPTILGRRLTLNPVVVFLSLVFWGWLWGVPGALMAVPLLMVFKIVCDHIESLSPIGEFLGQ